MIIQFARQSYLLALFLTGIGNKNKSFLMKNKHVYKLLTILLSILLLREVF